LHSVNIIMNEKLINYYSYLGLNIIIIFFFKKKRLGIFNKICYVIQLKEKSYTIFGVYILLFFYSVYLINHYYYIYFFFVL